MAAKKPARSDVAPAVAAGPTESKVRVHLPTVPAGLAELVQSDAFRPDLFALAQGDYTQEFVERVRKLKPLLLEPHPLRVPPDVERLARNSPQADVLVRRPHGDFIEPAASVAAEIQRTIDRQSKRQLFTAEEAALILADANGMNGKAMREAIDDAFASGELEFVDAATPLRRLDPRTLRGPYLETYGEFWPMVITSSYGAVTTRAALDAWIEKRDPAYLLQRFSQAIGRDDAPDSRRRLDALRKSGGDARKVNGKWRFKGVAKLVAAEKAAGRGRSDEKTVRRDLQEAVEAERSVGPTALEGLFRTSRLV
jgi:hypothetical protein